MTTAYPTDSHVEAKRRRELREKDKSPEEVKAMRKKKPQKQQEHFDDCGSDMELLNDNESIALLSLSEPCEACFHFDRSGLCATDNEMTVHLQDSDFNLSYLYGCEMEVDDVFFADRQKGNYIDEDKFLAYLSSHPGDVDILEICGGAAGVTRIAIRRRLTCGGNLDLVTGIE